MGILGPGPIASLFQCWNVTRLEHWPPWVVAKTNGTPWPPKSCCQDKLYTKHSVRFARNQGHLRVPQSLLGSEKCTQISEFVCLCQKKSTPFSKFVVPGQTVLLYQSLFVCCCARINCTPISKSVCLLLCQDKLYSYIKVSLFCCARINCTQSWCPTCSGPYLLGSATFPSTSRSSTTWSMTSGRCLIRQGGVWDHWIIR